MMYGKHLQFTWMEVGQQHMQISGLPKTKHTSTGPKDPNRKPLLSVIFIHPTSISDIRPSWHFHGNLSFLTVLSFCGWFPLDYFLLDPFSAFLGNLGKALRTWFCVVPFENGFLVVRILECNRMYWLQQSFCN